jgi:uncharacterized protein
MQPVITPFVGFIDVGHDPEFEPADDIEGRLDDAAAAIPRAVLKTMLADAVYRRTPKIKRT